MPHGKPLEFGCEDHWIWDPNAKTCDIFIPEPHIVIIHPSWSNSTSAIRGSKILNNGKHYWELRITNKLFGTSMMFGVGKKSARLHVPGFKNLMGEDANSWGLTHTGFVIHNGKTRAYTSPINCDRPTTLGLLFDGFEGTLTYFINGKCLGVAFTGLEKIEEALYPMVASTAAKTKVTLVKSIREYTDLQDMCRSVIARSLACPSQLDTLHLPPNMKSYIKKSLFKSSGDNNDNEISEYICRRSSTKPNFLF